MATSGYIGDDYPKMVLKEIYLWLPNRTVLAKAMQQHYCFALASYIVLNGCPVPVDLFCLHKAIL
jgi:hypothetical protein